MSLKRTSLLYSVSKCRLTSNSPYSTTWGPGCTGSTTRASWGGWGLRRVWWPWRWPALSTVCGTCAGGLRGNLSGNSWWTWARSSLSAWWTSRKLLLLLYQKQNIRSQNLECFSLLSQEEWFDDILLVANISLKCTFPLNVAGPWLYYRNKCLTSFDSLLSFHVINNGPIRRENSNQWM